MISGKVISTRRMNKFFKYLKKLSYGASILESFECICGKKRTDEKLRERSFL